MAGFFSRWTDKEEMEEPPSPPRVLTHPRALCAGDILKFRFMSVEGLSGQRFEVREVNGYLFNNKMAPIFVLESGSGQRVQLFVDEEGQEARLSISQSIKRRVVENLFDMQQFSRLFEANKEQPIALKRVAEEPASLAGWIAPIYYQTLDGVKGRYVPGDPRGRRGVGGGYGLDYYLLMSADERCALEVEVYDGGQTEVAVSVRLPVRYIEELWPGSD